MLLPVTISLVVGIAICQANLELPSPAPLQQRRPPYWASPAFRHECFQDCRSESHRKVTYLKAKTPGDQCEVSCRPTRVSWKHERSKTVVLRNPEQPSPSQSNCIVLVAKEDISCALSRSRSSTRAGLVRTQNFCRRINYRYYLGKSCDSEKRSEVGEETCREACVTGVSPTMSHSSDNNRTRAVFRPCYRGLLSQGDHYVEFDFCSVELKPCSQCFKWGNWTLASPCSRTCGSPGVRRFTRGCYITERSDIPAVYSVIESSHCKAYLGGADSKAEKCGMYTVCPQWTNWGQWSQCNAPASELSVKNCKTRMRMNITKDFIKDTAMPRQRQGTMSNNITNATVSSNAKRDIDTVKLDVVKQNVSTRRRVCLPGMHGCPGNSLQTRLCVHENDRNFTADNIYIRDCKGEETDESTAKETSTTHQVIEVSSDDLHSVTTAFASTTAARIHHKKTRRVNNRTFTVENEGGFTSVINNYAAVLITCLLIFIVVLLFALITICWKIMKRSRPTRYEAPPPSFSAGTLGSIPTVFGQGYPLPVGLRHGSGTFGRSEYPPNISDAISSKGSLRSSSSNVTNKGKSRNKRPPLSAVGVVLNAGSMRQQAKYSKASISELAKPQQSCNEPNMGSKKPSTSSLLSSASSVTGTPVSISSCPFQPLPPIPPDLPLGPSNNGKSFGKRNVSRSSSQNPDDTSRRSTIVSQQSRAGSLSGRPIEMSQLHDERTHTPPRNARGSFGRRLQSIEHQHVYRPIVTTEVRNTSDDDIAPTENEYWSVSREEDSVLPHLPISPPLRDGIREHRPLMRVSCQRVSERQRLRSYQSSDSAEFDSTELVDNVLYDEQKGELDRHSNAPHAVIEQSEHGSDSCAVDVNVEIAEEPFYNSIKPSASFAKGASSDSSAENEDEYDHLYKDSSTPNSPKGPHTLRVLTSTVEKSYKSHDYERIDISSKSTPTDTQKEL